MAHPPRIPVWLDREQDVVYFLTFCVQDRRCVLNSEKTFAAFKGAILKLEKWSIIAALLMPDHVHLLTAPKTRDESVGNLSGALKRWIRQDVDAGWKWQNGSFDRLLRSNESIYEKWLYIRENPVRAGLVKHWKDWPYRIGIDE